MKLTPKQARFVQEYPIDLNAAQAAIRAGYNARTARVIGHENLTKPHIAAAIEKAMAERAERTEVTADLVVGELRKIAFANIADYMKLTPQGDPYLDFSAHASYTGNSPPPAHRYRASTRSPLWDGAPIQPCLTSSIY